MNLAIKRAVQIRVGNFVLIFYCLFSIPAIGAADKSDALQLLSSGSSYVEFKFMPSPWQSDTLTVSSGRYGRIVFDGAELQGEVGAAALPCRVLTVAVPLQGRVDVQVVEAPYEEKSTLALLPIPELRSQEPERYERDQAWYSQDRFYPAEIVQVHEPSWLRAQRVVRVVVQPLQYNPAQGRVRLYRSVQVRVTFSGGSAGSASAVSKEEEIYKAALLNYDQGRQWRAPAPSRLSKSGRLLDTTNWYKLIISGDGQGGREGIYKVDGAALQKAGVSLASLDPGTLQLFNNGGRELAQEMTVSRPDSLVENPIQVIGGEDGKFDGGDYLLFYGRSLEGITWNGEQKRLSHYIHHYSYDNVYWLTYGKQKGKRIANKAVISSEGVSPESSFRDLVFAEEEKNNVLKSGLEWFGVGLSVEKTSFSQPFSLNGVVLPDTAVYRVQMAASSTGLHSFRVYANGNLLGNLSFAGDLDGYATRLATFKTAGALVEGNNTVSVNYLTNSYTMFSYADWIEVEYSHKYVALNDQLLFYGPMRAGVVGYKIESFSRDDISVWDVTDIAEISKIGAPTLGGRAVVFADQSGSGAPRRYAAFTPSGLRSVSAIKAAPRTELRNNRQSDYVIITFDDFYQQALQLKSLRENWDAEERLATEVVKISEVMDEFGWGISDPVAIRDFLASCYQRWDRPGYVLLLGDGHYDYKNIQSRQINRIIPFESSDRFEINSRTSDDWFTYIKERPSGMQMAMGRLAVQSVEEAQGVIDKIVSYETRKELGEWRKRIVVVGDDELGEGGGGEEIFHTQQAETLAEEHVPDLFNVAKIYLMEYPAVRTASIAGITKPLANEALIDQINQGALIINYIGHGADNLWSHERVLYEPTDFHLVQNASRQGLWVAATCLFSRWDQTDKQSLGETIINTPGRGAIAVISSARQSLSGNNAFFNRSLYDELFRSYASGGRIVRLGDAMMMAKQRSNSDVNSEKYTLLGDPAMRLGAPRYRAVIDRVTPDTLRALCKTQVGGYVEKEGVVWGDFNGHILLRVVDAKKPREYETKAGNKVNYLMPGNSIFRGTTAVTNGRFEVEFIAPKDISYGGSDGRLSVYFWDNNFEGTGHCENLYVGGTAVNLVDHEGPDIKIAFGEHDFMAGDYTSPEPLLAVTISDSLSGVNIAGDIGHQISMELDGQPTYSKDMTQFFEYQAGSYTTGLLRYQLTGLTDGLHTMQIKAWDNSNNSNVAETTFQVLSQSALAVRNLLNYPNPMNRQTQFTFELSNDALVAFKIYSVAGRLLKKIAPQSCHIGYNVFPETWDGADEDGDRLANGVYLYRLEAVHEDVGKKDVVEAMGKAVISR